MKKYGVQAYIDGHSHTMQYISFEGIEYMVQGVGSRTKSRLTGPHSDAAEGVKFVSLSNGFGAAIVEEDRVSISYIDDSGSLIFSHHINNSRSLSLSRFQGLGSSSPFLRHERHGAEALMAVGFLLISVIHCMRKFYRIFTGPDISQNPAEGYSSLP